MSSAIGWRQRDRAFDRPGGQLPLSEDLLSRIGSCLSIADLTRFRQVSRAWGHAGARALTGHASLLGVSMSDSVEPSEYGRFRFASAHIREAKRVMRALHGGAMRRWPHLDSHNMPFMFEPTPKKRWWDSTPDQIDIIGTLRHRDPGALLSTLWTESFLLRSSILSAEMDFFLRFLSLPAFFPADHQQRQGLAIFAARCGNDTLMHRCLEAEVTPEADLGRNGIRLLHFAAWYGHAAVVNELVSHRAAVDAEMEGGATPLMLAALTGHTEVVRILLEAGADASKQDRLWHPNRTAIDMAAHFGHREIVELLAPRMRDHEILPLSPDQRRNRFFMNTEELADERAHARAQARAVDALMVAGEEARIRASRCGWCALRFHVGMRVTMQAIREGGDEE